MSLIIRREIIGESGEQLRAAQRALAGTWPNMTIIPPSLTLFSPEQLNNLGHVHRNYRVLRLRNYEEQVGDYFANSPLGGEISGSLHARKPRLRDSDHSTVDLNTIMSLRVDTKGIIAAEQRLIQDAMLQFKVDYRTKQAGKLAMGQIDGERLDIAAFPRLEGEKGISDFHAATRSAIQDFELVGLPIALGPIIIDRLA